MSDYLKSKIEERRSRIATLQRDLELQMAELRAYEDALSNGRPHDGKSQVGPVLVKTPSQMFGDKGGLVPDSHWPDVISRLGANGAKFTTDQVERELGTIGKPIQRKSVRAKLAVLAKKGRLKRVKDGVYRLVPEIKDQEAA